MAETNKNGDKLLDRAAALENALKQIDRQFGKGTLMRLGDQEKIEMEAISTGSIALD
ncbi:MAG: DNA recombination/repair protein RecA, partial [Peptococcaceae bacterium]